MFHTLKQESVKVIRFYKTAKFDVSVFNPRNVMIVFWFYANEAFGHALICLSANFFPMIVLFQLSVISEINRFVRRPARSLTSWDREPCHSQAALAPESDCKRWIGKGRSPKKEKDGSGSTGHSQAPSPPPPRLVFVFASRLCWWLRLCICR